MGEQQIAKLNNDQEKVMNDFKLKVELLSKVENVLQESKAELECKSKDLHDSVENNSLLSKELKDIRTINSQLTLKLEEKDQSLLELKNISDMLTTEKCDVQNQLLSL